MKENLNLYLLKAYTASARVTQNKLWLAISLLSFLFILINETASAQTGSAKADAKNEQLITGVVRDNDDPQPLVGVSVLIKGTQTGVLTDDQGRFSIRVDVSKYDMLVFSFIGKKTVELSLAEKGNTINLTLYNDPSVFTELVVTGEATGEIYSEKKSGRNRFWTKVKGLF